MSFRSTRTGQVYTFKEAVISGWASDKGMILPQQIPKVSSDMLESWVDCTYAELVFNILSLFFNDEDQFPELESIIKSSFNDFLSEDVVPINELAIPSSSSKDIEQGIYVAELFLGPSLAFKDLGMQVLCRVLEHFLKEENQKRVILVGTSGDTGPSALEASKDNTFMQMLVLYPLSRVSTFQQAQMLRANAEYHKAKVIAVEGTSDDLDIPCANVFSEPKFIENQTLGTVNSVNVIRLLVQVVHFFYIHLQLCKEKRPSDDTSANYNCTGSTSFSYCIPTGAGGHITACIIAKLMGLPISSILLATNENDVLHKMLKTGKLQKKEVVVATNAPAMDIQAPYNIERILRLLLTYEDPDNFNVHEFMETFNSGQEANLPLKVLNQMQHELQIRSTVVNGATKHSETGCESVLSTIQKVYSSTGTVLDPHTAIGVAGALELRRQRDELYTAHPVVCMGCAHPLKFTDTIAEALQTSIEDATEIILSTGSNPNKLRAIWESYQKYFIKDPKAVDSCHRFLQEEESLWTTQLIEVIDSLRN